MRTTRMRPRASPLRMLLATRSATASFAAARVPVLVGVCRSSKPTIGWGRPPSRSVKSSFVRPPTGWPSRSSTTTSTVRASAWAGTEGGDGPACPESVAAAARASAPPRPARIAGRAAADMALLLLEGLEQGLGRGQVRRVRGGEAHVFLEIPHRLLHVVGADGEAAQVEVRLRARGIELDGLEERGLGLVALAHVEGGGAEGELQEGILGKLRGRILERLERVFVAADGGQEVREHEMRNRGVGIELDELAVFGFRARGVAAAGVHGPERLVGGSEPRHHRDQLLKKRLRL